MYYHGYGVQQDFAEAVRWYRKAAEQGYAIAQYYLGFRYYKRTGSAAGLCAGPHVDEPGGVARYWRAKGRCCQRT